MTPEQDNTLNNDEEQQQQQQEDDELFNNLIDFDQNNPQQPLHQQQQQRGRATMKNPITFLEPNIDVLRNFSMKKSTALQQRCDSNTQPTFSDAK